MSSRVRLVVVMDPIAAIKPAKDTTLGLLLAAQARGWDLHYAELKDLWLRDGVAWGRLAPLKVTDDPAGWFSKEEYASFNGEPVRGDLTEPPAGYRVPSPNQPYGISPDKKKSGATAQDMMMSPVTSPTAAPK